MNLHWIDWAIIGGVILLLFMAAFCTKQYTRSVTDFLSANRCAGRYLLTMAQGMAGMGAITIVAGFEKYYSSGMPCLWWYFLIWPIPFVIAISGWIIYRYRQTRALTMAQFLEMRYSRRLRIFAGILAYVSGVINYGIFPGVTARFFIYFADLPQYFVHVGPVELNITLGIVMFITLSIALAVTFLGGQIAVMVTDFLQGQIFNITCLVIIIILVAQFGFSDIFTAIKQAPTGKSMLNPFDQVEIPDFTFSFFAILAFMNFYGYMAWQGGQGYYCSAKSPHEARMARILGTWRGMITTVITLIIPICAYVLLNSAMLPETASQVQDRLAEISDTQILKQVRVSVAISHLLPVGAMGLFFSIMLSAAISTDDTYLHSWGSVLIQDVVMPLRKKPLSNESHLKLLKFSILGVAIFAWTFSMLFPLKDYIYMFWQLTGAIFVGGAGSVIIGGLYWKRGTTAGAWTGMITGAVLAVAGIVLRNIFWPYLLPGIREAYPQTIWLTRLPEKCPLDGQELGFIAALAAIAGYIVVSLLTRPDPDFDLDKVLNRGKYAIDKDASDVQILTPARGLKVLGISNEFTKMDKYIYFTSLGWTFFLLIAVTTGFIWQYLFGTTEDGWAIWWMIILSLMTLIGFLAVIWFTFGGFRDMFRMFRALKEAQQNELDDGRVFAHHNQKNEGREKSYAGMQSPEVVKKEVGQV